MAYYRYLIFAMMSLIFFLNSCGSAKKVKINAAPTPAKSAEKVNTKTQVQKIKSSNSFRKLSVAEQVDRYVKTYAEVAQQEMKSYDIPASITLAQGILESGMGDSRLATQANNHFGIKCHKEWGGKRIYHDDDEKGEDILENEKESRNEKSTLIMGHKLSSYADQESSEDDMSFLANIRNNIERAEKGQEDEND